MEPQRLGRRGRARHCGASRGAQPLTTTIGSSPYLDVQTAHDLAFSWGGRSFIKSQNANDVRPEALDEPVELVGTAPPGASFSITALGGAISGVPEDATAYAGRAAAFDLSTDSDWDDAADDEANIEWCRRAMAVFDPDRALGAYANGNSDTGPEESRRSSATRSSSGWERSRGSGTRTTCST